MRPRPLGRVWRGITNLGLACRLHCRRAGLMREDSGMRDVRLSERLDESKFRDRSMWRAQGVTYAELARVLGYRSRERARNDETRALLKFAGACDRDPVLRILLLGDEDEIRRRVLGQ